MTTKELEHLQMIENEKVCSALKTSGDDIEIARKIVHTLEFISEYKRRDLIEELEELGYVINENFTTEEGYNGFTFEKDDTVTKENIDTLTLFLIELTDEHDAKYQGWSTSIAS